MKKIALVMVLLIAFGVSTSVFAQAEEAGDGSELVTQGELAQMMVRMLGLYRYLPPDPTDGESFAILMVNKISPADGWNSKAAVTREDLARVAILAMGEGGSVENPDDPDSWVAALQAMGVDIESIGQVVAQVPPSEDFKSAGYSPGETDPIKQRRYFARPDERQLQSDLGNPTSIPLTLNEVRYVVRGLDPNDFKPTPATPN